MQNRKIALVLMLGVVAANAHGSNSVEFQLSGHRLTWLRISAFTDLPLADGDVAVYDTAGRLLFEKRHATNSQGVFPAGVRAQVQACVGQPSSDVPIPDVLSWHVGQATRRPAELPWAGVVRTGVRMSRAERGLVSPDRRT